MRNRNLIAHLNDRIGVIAQHQHRVREQTRIRPLANEIQDHIELDRTIRDVEMIVLSDFTRPSLVRGFFALITALKIPIPLSRVINFPTAFVAVITTFTRTFLRLRA